MPKYPLIRFAGLLLLCTIVSTTLAAQTCRQYSYDAAGNRSLRQPGTCKAVATEPTGSASDLLPLLLMPNPATTWCMVRADTNFPPESVVQLLALNGTTLWQQALGNGHIDLTNLPNGMYIVVLQHGEQRKTAKLIKE